MSANNKVTWQEIALSREIKTVREEEVAIREEKKEVNQEVT